MNQTPVAIDAQERMNCPLMQHLSYVDDPRHPKLRVHLLYDILVIIVLGLVCGAKSLVLVETWAREKEAFLRTFLRLPGGIPSHDTLSRVLSMLQPSELQKCLVHWSEALRTRAGQGVIAIDGKTLRRTFDRAAQKSALHLVSAFCTAEHLVLGQMGSEAKKNEVAAIQALLPLLDIRGSLVTMDAMGCQKSIAAQIRQQGGDFLLALKSNHKTLYRQVGKRFDKLTEGCFKPPFHPARFAVHQCPSAKAHGRMEQSTVTAMDVTGWLTDKSHGLWAKLVTSVIQIKSVRTTGHKTTTELRYYLCSLPFEQVERIAGAIRSHWAVEQKPKI